VCQGGKLAINQGEDDAGQFKECQPPAYPKGKRKGSSGGWPAGGITESGVRVGGKKRGVGGKKRTLQ